MQLEQRTAARKWLVTGKSLAGNLRALHGNLIAALGSATAVELFRWHAALLVPTLGFKYLFVRRLSFTAGLEAILASMGDGIQRYVRLVLLLTVDILEVSIIVGLLYLVGRILLRLSLKSLIFASVFVCLMIMGLNQYSLLLVASLVTIDTFAISASWAVDQPDVVWQSLRTPQVGFIALSLVWASLASLAVCPPARMPGIARRFCQLFSGAVVLGTILGLVTMSRMRAEFPAVLRGYWSSTLVSFFKLDAPPRSALDAIDTASILTEYERLIYPLGRTPKAQWLTHIAPEKVVPRHVLIVTLETAPLKFYPIADNPALPTFYRMSRQAITSDRHYAMSPYTWWNNASILSGTYFVHKGKGIFDYGEFETDSIVSILARRGYLTSFVESSKHGWGQTTGFWKNLGFAHLLDSDGDAVPFARKSYAVIADKERQSFERATDAIIEAEKQRTKAMVLLATTLGHYPWLARPGEESGNSKEILLGLADFFDQLFGKLLEDLEKHGLGDQVLIVVTGDHGFRMRTEFESVGAAVEHGDLAFNVPFLLYAPAIFMKQVRLPHATSHVDIAPTLLALMGMHDNAWLHHGEPMFDRRLRDRIIFMMNTNLSPISGFRSNGCHYTFNDMTGKARAAPPSTSMLPGSAETASCAKKAPLFPDEAVKARLEAASRMFDKTFINFQSRRRRDPRSANIPARERQYCKNQRGRFGSATHRRFAAVSLRLPEISC